LSPQFAEFEPKLPLTAREVEVLNEFAAGKSMREVSQGLHISQNTTKNHVRNIIEKLRLFNELN
jgi:DNA-binding CsgD family transcriptional regulator